MVTAICNSICFQFLNAVPIISGGNLNSNCVSHPPPWKNLSFRSRNCRNICFRSGIRVFSGKKFSVVCEVPVVNQSEFSEEVLRSDLPVLVEFVADWCGPCRLMSPAMDWASQLIAVLLSVMQMRAEWTSLEANLTSLHCHQFSLTYHLQRLQFFCSVPQEYKKSLKVVKIDHDSNPRLIEEYKVFGLPALIIFKSGKEVPNSRREGAMTKIKLKEYLDTLLESIAVT